MPDTSLGFTYPDASGNVNLWEHFQELATDINDYIASHGRIATELQTSDSATFTTANTAIGTVTAALVSGRTYKIRLITHIGTTTGGDTADVNIRENNTAGVEIQAAVAVPIPTNTAVGHYVELEGEYTAVATGSKTFVAVASRNSGSGTLRREAAATRPHLFYVDYTRG